MITFRELCADDICGFWEFLNILDSETDCMMYEPGERLQRTNVEELRADILDNVINGHDFLLTALDGGRIVGYIHAERGRFARNFHTAYIVTGILADYTGRGIGTVFFRKLDEWARESSVCRLELTVECRNTAAVRLYEKSGFVTEGTRAKSMRVGGVLVDEYYMGKIL